MDQDIQDIEVTSTGKDLTLAVDQIKQFHCPFLGLSNDRLSVFSYPSEHNKCYAFRDSEFVKNEKQNELCLTENFSECPLFQQMVSAKIGNIYTSGETMSSGRIPHIRTFAVIAMTILILLAALIWWPLPGLRIQDRTAFSASFSQSLQGAQIQDEEPAGQNEVSVVNPTDEKVNPVANSAKVSQPNDISQDVGQDAADSPPVLEESESLPKEDLSAAVDGADSEIIEMPEQTTEGNQSGREVFAEKSESKSEAAVQIVISDLPDLYQTFQIQQEGSGNAAETNSSFNPIAYSGQSVVNPLIADGTNDGKSLSLYQAPAAGDGQFIELSRYEPVNILGRSDDGDWLKVQTESGIEGWILTADTVLGDWVETLPVIENDSGAGEAGSVPTSLPMAEEAVIKYNGRTLRSAPGANFKRIALLNKGEAVSLLGRWQNGPWVRIRIDDGTEGWVKVDALTLSE